MSNGYDYERKLADLLESEGFHCERIASSGRRRNSVCDLVGIKEGISYLIEVKTRNSNVFYTKRFEKNFQKLIDVARRVKATPILAILFKRRGWKFLKLDRIPMKVSYD